MPEKRLGALVPQAPLQQLGGAGRDRADRRPCRRCDRYGRTPVKGRLSRHSRHFPVAPNVALAPSERSRQYLLSITTTDRIGLLYAITRVLATHDINVHTAKINTLGERVEDVFLVDGAMLEDERGQAQLERDLLEAISP